MARKPIHVGPGELVHNALCGCTVVSTPIKGGYSAPVKELSQTVQTETGPVVETIATPVVECDGFNHRVFDADGELIGEAPTLGLARQIARTGKPLPAADETTTTGGKPKGRK